LPWLLSSLPLYPQLFVRDSPDGVPIHALDCAVGTMPHFGNLYGLTRYVDKSLNHEDYIVFESGTPTDAIKLSYQDYERIAKPRIEDLATKLHPIKRA
jgi:hypothetical protein